MSGVFEGAVFYPDVLPVSITPGFIYAHGRSLTTNPSRPGTLARRDLGDRRCAAPATLGHRESARRRSSAAAARAYRWHSHGTDRSAHSRCITSTSLPSHPRRHCSAARHRRAAGTRWCGRVQWHCRRQRGPLVSVGRTSRVARRYTRTTSRCVARHRRRGCTLHLRGNLSRANHENARALESTLQLLPVRGCSRSHLACGITACKTLTYHF